MPPFEHHIFICTNQRPEGHPRGCCADKGSVALKDYFKEALKKRGLKTKIRANASGCLDACELGPAVVIYPEGVWYQVTTQADVEEIIEEHIAPKQGQGKVVQRLVIFKKAT